MTGRGFTGVKSKKKNILCFREVYQHTNVKIIDRMMLDVLKAADQSLLLETPDGKMRLSQAQDHLNSLIKLTDNFILSLIQSSSSEEAKNLLKRIQNEDYYKVRKGVNLREN